jgi:hypothetical protein
MRTEKDVRAYLSQLGRRYREVDERAAERPSTSTFLVETGAEQPPMAVRVEPPLVVVRVRVGDLKKVSDPAALFRQLLELNARQLVHASYGLDDGSVVLSSALELENLDFNELQATVDEIDMALATKFPGLTG